VGAGRLPFWVILINKSAFQTKKAVTERPMELEGGSLTTGSQGLPGGKTPNFQVRL
jgi:hypothetical protein